MHKQAQIAQGRQLRRMRRAKGLKQAELAVLLGVHQVTVSAWERGVTRIPDAMLERIAATLLDKGNEAV